MRERTCADGRLLESDAVVDEANVLGGLQRARALASEQVQHARAEHHVLAVFDELAQREQSYAGVGKCRRCAGGLLVCNAEQNEGQGRRKRQGAPDSLLSGLSSMIAKMLSTIARLYSKPPSSRSMRLRNVSSTPCLRGNLRQSVLHKPQATCHIHISHCNRAMRCNALCCGNRLLGGVMNTEWHRRRSL